MLAGLFAVFLLGACASDSDDVGASSDAVAEPVDGSVPVESGTVPPATDANSSSAGEGSDSAPSESAGGSSGPADANAVVTLGDSEYRFATETCSVTSDDGPEITGVITIDGQPAFVTVYNWTGGFPDDNDLDGLVAIDVGLDSDTPEDETLEDTIGRGLSSIWNLVVAAEDIEQTESTLRMSGEYLLVLATTTGSSGDTLDGSFFADCS